jgi:ADP-heptose:LPS heptosyltransferase
MGYRRVLEVVENRDYANTIVSVDRADMALLYQEEPSCSARLRGFLESFQLILVIGLNRGPLARNLRAVSGAEVLVFPPFPSAGKAVHMVDHFLGLPHRLGLPVHRDAPRLKLLDGDRRAATTFLEDQGIGPGGLLIALHPGSGSRAKMWPVERFLELANRFVSTVRSQVLFVMGPGEEDIKNVVESRTGSNIGIMLDNLHLPQLGAILERCRVFVGNDSGISHMAAAVGIPVVALFGPSDPVRWAPKGRDVYVIRKALSCSPCDQEMMSHCKDKRCLVGISVNEVHHVVHRIVNKRVEGSEGADEPRNGFWERSGARGALF